MWVLVCVCVQFSALFFTSTIFSCWLGISTIFCTLKLCKVVCYSLFCTCFKSIALLVFGVTLLFCSKVTNKPMEGYVYTVHWFCIWNHHVDLLCHYNKQKQTNKTTINNEMSIGVFQCHVPKSLHVQSFSLGQQYVWQSKYFFKHQEY